MALIKCKKCGQLISDKAETCPKCGTPNITNGKIQTIKENAFITNLYNNRILRFTLKSILVFLYLISFLYFLDSHYLAGLYVVRNLYEYDIYDTIHLLAGATFLGLIASYFVAKSKKVRKYCMLFVLFLSIVPIGQHIWDINKKNANAKKYNTIELLRNNVAGTIWYHEKGGIKLTVDDKFVYVQIQENGKWNVIQKCQYEFVEVEVPLGFTKFPVRRVLGLQKMPAIKWENMNVDYNKMPNPDSKGCYLVPEVSSMECKKRIGYHYFIPMIRTYYYIAPQSNGWSSYNIVLYYMNFEGKNNAVPKEEYDTKIDLSTTDSISSATENKTNPEIKVISDWERMGLNGPVKELKTQTEYFESESEYIEYHFNEKGMLTKSENELVGYPSGFGGVGMSNTCIYKDGILTSSVFEDTDGSSMMFYYEYQELNRTQTDVYRINSENDQKEKAMSLHYNADGNLIKKVVYYNIDSPTVFEYNDGVLKNASEDNSNEAITQKDSNGNWIEMDKKDEGCRITREISYY